MARAFASASTQYLINANAVLTDEPITMAAWARAAQTNAANIIMSINRASGGQDRWSIFFNSTAKVNATAADAGGGSGSTIDSTGSYSANTWHHVAGTFLNDTGRSVWLDGTETVGPGTSRTVASVDQTTIGVQFVSGATSAPLNGEVAEAAIWNVVLTAAEMASLAKGFCPLFIRPASLVAYWPLIGRHDPEICPKGGFNMTLINTPTTARHCRVFNARRARLG